MKDTYFLGGLIWNSLLSQRSHVWYRFLGNFEQRVFDLMKYSNIFHTSRVIWKKLTRGHLFHRGGKRAL